MTYDKSYKANREYFLNYAREYRKKNRDLTNRLAEESRLRHPSRDKFTKRRWHLKDKYDLSIEQYDNMYLEQNGKCLICKEIPANNRTLHVDHDHDSGKIRGLLCSKCNGALGWFEKREQFIMNYLKRDDDYET